METKRMFHRENRPARAAWRRLLGAALGCCAAFATGALAQQMPEDQHLREAVQAAERGDLAAAQQRFAEFAARRWVAAQMAPVAGGTFTMGCTPEQPACAADEKPAHAVRVAGFEISRYEITQQAWTALMGENPSTFADCPQCPVETVSWDDVQRFLERLNAGGGRYRLPTEAEWEFAARGGTLGRGLPYAGSGDWDAVAWYYANSGSRTHPVGLKQENELGLFDMSGNVREWVQDCYHDNYEGAPAAGRAWEKSGEQGEQAQCQRRAIRSGSWYGKSGYVTVSNRFWYAPYFRNNNLGFRVVRPTAEE